MTHVSGPTAFAAASVRFDVSLEGSEAAVRTANALEPITDQIDGARHALETTSDRTKELLARQTTIEGVIAAIDAAGGKEGAARVLHDLVVSLPDGRRGTADELLRQVGALELADPEGDGKVTASGLRHAVEELRTSREGINNDNQLRMIQLQELMHQKDLMLQLATQELSSRQQIERRIAENIR